MISMKLRGQTVGAAEQELGVLDGQAAQQHGQAVDAQTKTAVRRAAVLEELQIELDILGQTLFLSLLLQHFVAVLTLGTGGDLHTAPDQVVALRKNNLTGPIALVLGSEGSGVSQLVKKLCDGVVRLDMAAPGTGVDSYNVSVAAGIILYEIQSQRAVEE